MVLPQEVMAMPKTSYCRTAADDYADLAKVLKVSAFAEFGSVGAAGEKLKTMCPSTFYAKVKTPEKMTIEELRDVRRTCKADKEALLDVLRRIL